MNLITNIPGELAPGDICLYHTLDVTDALIEWKEGDPDTAHIEIYMGAGISFASRNGIGVNSYAFRTSGLVHVRRPTQAFCRELALPQWAKAKGAPYGWSDIGANLNLLQFPEEAWTRPQLLMKTGMDCSHFAAVFLYWGLCPQFDLAFDYRKITPRDFKTSLGSKGIWDWQPQNGQDGQDGQDTKPLLTPRAEGEAQP